MISEKLQKAINEQITAEMWSSNLYLAMSFALFVLYLSAFLGRISHRGREKLQKARNTRRKYCIGCATTCERNEKTKTF